jgi:hypothetical protein
MEEQTVEALIVRIEEQEIAVLSAKSLPSDRRSRDALLDGVKRCGQFEQFVVVEKFDGVSQELIAVDLEAGRQIRSTEKSDSSSGLFSDFLSDVHFDLAAAALAKLVSRGNIAVGSTWHFLHRTSGIQAQVVHHAAKQRVDSLGLRSAGESFAVTLLRQPRPSQGNQLSDLEIRHAYLDAPSVKVSLPEHGVMTVSVFSASHCVYAEPGKTVIVALRADTLAGSKKKGAFELGAIAQQKLVALIKHVAACLHIAQSAVQTLLIWPSQEADFYAAQWSNERAPASLHKLLSASALVALAELVNVPGSVVQGMARVLPGVPTRIAHSAGVVEIMATANGVTRAVRALPVCQGKLFSHSI